MFTYLSALRGEHRPPAAKTSFVCAFIEHESVLMTSLNLRPLGAGVVGRGGRREACQSGCQTVIERVESCCWKNRSRLAPICAAGLVCMPLDCVSSQSTGPHTLFLDGSHTSTVSGKFRSLIKLVGMTLNLNFSMHKTPNGKRAPTSAGLAGTHELMAATQPISCSLRGHVQHRKVRP